MARRILAAVLVILMPACGGSIDTLGPIPLLLITPTPARVAVGATVTLTADVLGVDPGVDRTAISWANPAPQIATLTASGATAVVRGVSPGSVTVTATHVPTRMSSSVLVEVTP
jgi:uncharacterized protein YjdB